MARFHAYFFADGKVPWWYRKKAIRAMVAPVLRRRAFRRLRKNPPLPPQTKDHIGPAPELIRVVPVARRVDFDGGHWWITALTFWDDRVSIESAVWDDTWSFESRASPGKGRGAPNFHWRMLIEDKAATRYMPKAGGHGSGGHWHRVGAEFEPSPPASATELTIALTRRAWPAANGEPPGQLEEVARVTVDLE